MRRVVLFLILGLALHATVVAQDSVGGGSTERPTSAEQRVWQPFGEAHQFLFFAVLEGLYKDGVSSADVSGMLRVEDGQSYTHFIANCPICNTVLQAMRVYAARFQIGEMYKEDGHQVKESTFGTGLSEVVQARLASEKPEERLKAMYQLVSTWFNRRLQRTILSDEERARLLAEIEAGKARGMRLLEGFKKQGEEKVEQLAPAYVNIDACAMCNAASNTEFEGIYPMALSPDGERPSTTKGTE